jgi:transmembrane sensor
MATESMETRDDIEHAAATWIARRDSGTWTDADATSLEAWLAESVGHRVAYYRLNAAWSEAGRVRALRAGAPVVAAARGAVVRPATTPSLETPLAAEKPRRRPLVLAAAASVLILIAATTLVTFRHERSPTPQHFTTVVGGLQAIPMSDGSRVTLNTDSDLLIALTAHERSVAIEHGEAFFEVAHDPSRPFVVKVGARRVIAVGTQFSVRREGADVRVVVAEGIVRFDDVLLPAGSVARAQGDEAVQVQRLAVADAERSLTWRNGFITFRNTPLAEAVAELNRYNTHKIVIEDPAIAAIKVGGVFRAGNVDPFVRLLERGFGIQSAVEPDRIVLKAP